MTDQKTTKTACPNCATTYKLPESFIGKKVTCKRCGTKFRASSGNSPKTYPIIGKLALKYGIITQKQLDAAMAHQAAHGSPENNSPLEKVFFEKGFISKPQVSLLHLAKKYWEAGQLGKGFCKLAIGKEFITRQDAETALKTQSDIFKKYRTIQRVCDILCESGKITEIQRETILAKQGRMCTLSPVKKEIETAAEPEKTPSITEEESATDTAGAGEEFELLTSNDSLSATLRPSGGMPASNTTAYVHDLLTRNKITTGIIEDDKIAKYMKTDALKGKPLIVAQGKLPEPGADATLKYHYETEQKVGKILAGGKIDYRDRGQIPHVKKDSILIEKIPITPGKPGTDIYGQSIEPPKTADVKLRMGAGTAISDDGLKLLATTDGQPKMTFGGRLSVLTELKIDGDVNLKTGHIDFDGNIVVRGAVQSGFKIRGHALNASEINGSDIKVTGDIAVSGGIIGATINSQGNISAKFIKNTTISTFGNIAVAKEITDATIETSGACNVTSGKILSSTISAKQGIQAKDIGTDVSSPCRLTAGADAHIEKEVQGIKNAIARREEKIMQLKGQIATIDINKQSLHQKITQLAQVQDRSLVEQRSIQDNLKAIKETAPSEAAAEAEKKIKELDQKAKDAEIALGDLFDQQDAADEKITEIETQLSELQEKIDELTDEKRSIEEWSKTQKAVAVVSASGPIHTGTIITGVHTQLRLKETCRHVRIQEVKVTDPDAAAEWEMRISPFK